MDVTKKSQPTDSYRTKFCKRCMKFCMARRYIPVNINGKQLVDIRVKISRENGKPEVDVIPVY